MLAYFNKYRNEINFLDDNKQGVLTVNNGTTIVKTNNVLQFSFDSLSDCVINIPKGNYIIHINSKFLNNDITFLDKFESLQEVLENPYKINLNINDTSIDSLMLVNTTDPLIIYNYTTAINCSENVKLSITSNYNDMTIIKINIVLEELSSNFKVAYRYCNRVMK